MFYTASKKSRPDHPRPRTGYGGNPSSVFRTPTPCNDTLRETANGARLGKNFASPRNISSHLSHTTTWRPSWPEAMSQCDCFRRHENRIQEMNPKYSTSHRLRRLTVVFATVRLRFLCEHIDFKLPEPGQTSHCTA
jgi:hypothetical protein